MYSGTKKYHAGSTISDGKMESQHKNRLQVCDYMIMNSREKMVNANNEKSRKCFPYILLLSKTEFPIQLTWKKQAKLDRSS